MATNHKLLGVGLGVFALFALALTATESSAGGLGGLAKSIRNLKPGVPNPAPAPKAKPKPEVEKVVELEVKQFGFLLIKPDVDVVNHFGLPKEGGLMISRVRAETPASKAGLKENDFLVELNGQPVPRDTAAFSKSVAGLKEGAAVDVILIRAGKRETIKGLTPMAKVF